MTVAAGSKQVVLSHLPDKDRERFYDFLLANQVDFVPKGDGYVATVRIVSGEDTPAKLESSARKGQTTKTPRKPRSLPAKVAEKPRNSVTEKPRNSVGPPLRSDEPVPQRVTMDLLKHDEKKKSDSKKVGDEHVSRGVETRSTSSLEIKMSFPRFSNLLSEEQQITAMRRPQLFRLLDELYETRFTMQVNYEYAAQEAESMPQRPLMDFPDFVFDFISKHYGLRKITHRMCWALLSTVQMLRSDHIAVELFARFLQESLDHTTDLVFYMNARKTVDLVWKDTRVGAEPQTGRTTKTKETSLVQASLTAKQCILIVRALTKDQSYSELQTKIFESLDEEMEKIEADEQGVRLLEADRLLWIVTDCYSSMRQEQEDKASETDYERPAHQLSDLPMPNPADDDNHDDEPPSTEKERSAEERQEDALRALDQDAQDKVQLTAKRIMDKLDELGSQSSRNEVYDWTIKTAIRSQARFQEISEGQKRGLVGSVYNTAKPQFDVTQDEMRRAKLPAVSDTGSTKGAAKPKMQVKLEPENGKDQSKNAAERERVLQLPPAEFENALEEHVRLLLLSATEDLAVAALRAVKLTEDKGLIETLIEEFTPVADAMMEALVTESVNDWLEHLKIEPPGSEEQLTHFENLYLDFRSGLNGTISSEVVYGLCKAVTATPALEQMVKNRAKEIKHMVKNRAKELKEGGAEAAGDQPGDENQPPDDENQAPDASPTDASKTEPEVVDEPDA